MAKIQNKWLAADAVDESKIKLSNAGSLRARNNADSADVNLFNLDASDELQFEAKPKYSSAPVNGDDLTNKTYVDAQVGGLAAAVEYKGTWDASLNSPSLADGVGTTGDLYRVNVAGSQDLGSGSISFDVGDKIVYNPGGTWEKWDDTDAVSSVAGKSGAVVLDTDDVTEAGNLYWTQARFDTAFGLKSTSDLTEGSGLYFTDGRAQTAAVSDLVYGAGWASVTNVAPSKAQVYAKFESLVDVDTIYEPRRDIFTLASLDITNGYVDLTQSAINADSLRVFPVGGPEQEFTADYTVALTGGAGGVTRVTFAGDLASALAAGDKLVVAYEYSV